MTVLCCCLQFCIPPQKKSGQGPVLCMNIISNVRPALGTVSQTKTKKLST